MKDGELIAGYEHNGKNYKIIYYKNSLRCICLDSNGKYYSNFNDEERGILISVIKGLIVNKKRSRFSGYYNVEDEMYEIYYDLASKNYFWYSSSGVNNVNHNVMLNKLFNDIPDVVYKKDVTDRTYQKFKLKLYKELKRYYGRRLANSIWDENDITRMAMYVDHAKVDKKRGIKKFFVKAGVSLALLAELVTLGNIWKVSIENRDNSFYNSTEYSYVDTQASAPVEFEIEIDEAIVEEKVEYSWDVVKDAIESNPNLTDIEKKFLLELRFVFDECHQYMDLDLVISRLSSLKITYDKNYDVLKSGMYIPSQNEIIIYNSSSFEDADFSTLLHEVCHVFQDFSGHNLLELSNSMFTAECLKKLHLNGGLDRLGHKIYDEFNLTNVYDYYEKGGYHGTRDYYQLLANLLSKETLLQYNFTCNHDLIVNELCFNSVNYREDAIRAYDLLRNIHYCVEEQQKKGAYTVNDNIMIDLEYFYNLNGMSMATNVDCFMIFLDRKGCCNYNDFVENGVSLEFLMQYVGKEEYLEYSDSIYGYFCSNYKSYFFDDSSNKIIYFCFDSSLSQEFISSLLIENGDLDKWQNNKVYSVIVNEDFELAYTNYISNCNIFKK